MTTISTATAQEMREIERAAQKATRGCATLEEASQRYTHLIHERFRDSVVLARVFATVPYGELPADNRRFVDELASARGVAELVHPNTLTLSLLGTSGVEPEWNDRRRSRGHVGIPLVSASFIHAIPMVARLLSELGLGFDWIDRGDADVVVKTLGSVSGVFYVADAANALDAQGRRVIPAQEFVDRYGVRSVLGVGGAYVGTMTFITVILFCRESISRARAEEFVAHINRFKASTIELVRAGKIFAQDPANWRGL